jgi:phosphate transport system permease protein
MKRKQISQIIAFSVFTFVTMLVIGILFVIVGFVIVRGIPVVDWEFLTGMPEEGMTRGGILPAIAGTGCLIAGSILFAFPVGILSGIYLNEYLKDNWFRRFIIFMTNNLAGVPSIIFGLFGMALFVNYLGFGDSILAGSLTLGLLTLPVVIRTTEEALKGVDDSLRSASMSLGATKLQTIRRVVLPVAFPNISTGLILSIGRVSGETAPILFTVAAYFLPQLPQSIFDQVMALPYHLYALATSGTNMEEARPMAYGTALVLVVIVILINVLANFLRRKLGKQRK